MASSGPNSPGTAAFDSSYGTGPLYNPNNCKVQDTSYAVVYETAGGGWSSHYLKATNFGFSIPSGATIDGITVDIRRRASSNNASYYSVDDVIKLVKGGTVVGTNKASGTNWSTTFGYYTYGSSSDLWGSSWTHSDINDSNFGMVISGYIYAYGKGYSNFEIDHVRITVNYTEGGGGGPTSASALLLAGD